MITNYRKPNDPKKIGSIKYLIFKHLRACVKTDSPLYSLWYCGITNDPANREIQHKNPKFIKYFDANTMNDAQIIERDMSIWGMVNSPEKGEARKGSKYVYVFKMGQMQK